MAMLESGEAASIIALATRFHVDHSYAARTLRLASLAPGIVEMVVRGHEPHGLTLGRLMSVRSQPLRLIMIQRALRVPGKELRQVLIGPFPLLGAKLIVHRPPLQASASGLAKRTRNENAVPRRPTARDSRLSHCQSAMLRLPHPFPQRLAITPSTATHSAQSSH